MKYAAPIWCMVRVCWYWHEIGNTMALAVTRTGWTEQEMRNAKTTKSKSRKISAKPKWTVVSCCTRAIWELQQWNEIQKILEERKEKNQKKNQKIRWINGQTNRRIKYKHDQNRCWCFYLLKLSLVPVLMPLHFSVRRLSLVRHCGNVWEVIRCEWDGSRCASETQSQTSNKNDRRTPYEKCWSNGMPARQRRNEHAERWISVGCESTADESMCTQWINVLAHIRQRREINADIRIGRKAIDEESMFDRFLWVCEKCLKRQKSAIKCIKKR